MKRYQTKHFGNGRFPKFSVKKLCVLFMALFTLVMAADIVNLFVTPARDQIGFVHSGGETPPFVNFSGGQGGSQGHILQAVRGAWLPILAACILGDAVCLLFYLRFRGKQQGNALEFENISGMEPLADDPDEPPKRKHNPWIAIICLAVIFALILSMMPASGGQASSVTVQEKVLSGTPEAAQIHTVLSGAGTLEANSLTAVTVPQQVTVLKYHVRNGEAVSAGDPLVSVDKTSAASSMMELQKVLEELDADLESERRKEKSSYLNASASGRVKEIYVHAGDTVSGVLYDQGALMLLSLDGLMKVTFPSDLRLTVGETVTVKYASGSEEGKISSVREGTVTVTLSDKTAPYGAEASVQDESGSTIGQGKLAINSELKVIGYYGTVKSVSVSIGDRVSVGNTLMVLQDTGHTTDYQLLLARRQELEAQMEKLSQLSQTGMITAEKDGIISGVPDNAEIELLSHSGSGKAGPLAASNNGYRLILLSSVTAPASEEPPDAAPTPSDGPASSEDGAGNADDDPQDGSSPDNENTDDGDLDGGGGQEEEEPDILSGKYAAKVAGVSNGKLYVYYCPMASEGEELSGLQGQMTEFGEFAFSGSVSLTANGETSTVDASQLTQGDLLWLTISEGIVTAVAAQRGASGQEDGMPPVQSGDGMPGGAQPSGGVAGGGMSGGITQVPAYEQYIIEQTELLYVSDQNEVALTISVDELDILSLQSGLNAQVTLDAMKGRSFQGTVKKIGSQGTNEGGNTKFSVTVTLPREAAMLDGMNASVKIVTATNEAAIAIPSAALVEDDGKTYVYTAYDEKEDTLGGLTEVETGASDGELVEILSGLSAEDTFYYRYAGTVTYSFLTVYPEL